MKKNLLCFLISFVFIFLAVSSIYAEQFTVSTYYPAPYGVYKQLRLYPTNDYTPGAACTGYKGTMYYDDSDSHMYICDGNTWQALGGGYWQVGTGAYANTIHALPSVTNVGIGTTIPDYQLTITQNFQLPITAVNGTAGVIYAGTNRFIHNYGTGNTFLGIDAGNPTMSGGGNTGVGSSALNANTTGSLNTAVGFQAMKANTAGYGNTAVGSGALQQNIAGAENTAFGTGALGNSTSDRNTAVGNGALASLTGVTGRYNVAMGFQAGYNNTGGEKNVYLGYQAGPDSLIQESNQLYINNASGKPLIYGDFLNHRVGIYRIATTYALEVEGNAYKTGAGTIWVSSDKRIKTDIHDLNNALEIINQLHPVKFRYTKQYKSKHPSIKDHYYYNFIAQEFQKVFPDSVQKNAEGYLDMDSYPVTPYLVAAVKEMKTIAEGLKKENQELKKEIGALESDRR